MRKIVLCFIAFCLIAGVFPPSQVTFAATETPKIVDVQENTILLSDGTIWIKRLWTSSGYEYINIDAVEIQAGLNSGYALNSKGELISWGNNSLPIVDKTQTNIKKLFNNYYLKTDGTVWYYDGKPLKNVKDVLFADYDYRYFTYINQEGEIFHTAWSNLTERIDKIENTSSIVSLKALGDDSLAYLDNTGKITVYSSSVRDYNEDNRTFTYLPKVIMEDAVHIELINKDKLLATKKMEPCGQ